MAYPPRLTPKGVVFHVLNRAVLKRRIFDQADDYEAFMRCLAFAHARVPVDLFAYCLMPNHFHLVLTSNEDGQASKFMKLLQATHGKRWHVCRGTVGNGAVYQSRFKAFPIQTNRHFYAVCRYVERNALRAGLVQRAEEWPWGSLSRMEVPNHSVPLAEWPVVRPNDWVGIVNDAEPESALAGIRKSASTGRPFGDPAWAGQIAKALEIEERLGQPGRPMTDL